MKLWEDVFYHDGDLFSWEPSARGYVFFKLCKGFGESFYDHPAYMGKDRLAFYEGESSELPHLHNQVEAIKQLRRQRAAIKVRYGQKPASIKDWWQ